jgi:tetratricopeptide (TPR) repeat protein
MAVQRAEQIGLLWVRIPAGTFQMGSMSGDIDEQPIHTVQLNEFEMSKTEVTVGQYRKCVEARVCSAPYINSDSCTWTTKATDREDLPINCVDWIQSRAFAKWVGADLPTEAEWEYAARGGQDLEYAGSRNPNNVAWYSSNSDGKPHPVSRRQANGYGLYDMSGNVWEWTLDEYKMNYNGAPRNGHSAVGCNTRCDDTEKERVSRGGSWFFDASRPRSTRAVGQILNTMELVRREIESKKARQDKAVEQKLIRMIKVKPDTDPQKPLILDSLATFYWQMAGDAQDKAYNEEAEQSRAKAIEIYKHIVQTFPNFEQIDRILFALAFNYQQKQVNEDAKAIYTEIIQNFQQSPVLPDALFNLADIYFAAGDVDSASALYGHVMQNFPKSFVYVYAIYKLGWCAYNQADFEGALGHFVKVIDLQSARSTTEQKLEHQSLRNEALRSLILAYVNIGGAAGGIALIRKYGRDDYNESIGVLYESYVSIGKIGIANDVIKTINKSVSKKISSTHRAEDDLRVTYRLSREPKYYSPNLGLRLSRKKP